MKYRAVIIKTSTYYVDLYDDEVANAEEAVEAAEDAFGDYGDELEPIEEDFKTARVEEIEDE